MPVYVNTKKLLTIPRYDESDVSENEIYLNDPDMLFDRLPQPFRLINKIVNKICNDAWCSIVELNEIREQERQKRYVESVFSMDRLPDEESVLCMCMTEKNHLMTGMKDGVTLWQLDGEKQIVLDKWKDDGMNTVSLGAYKFGENIYLVTAINEDGSARILAVILGRMYLIKEYPGSKDGDKPTQVTNITLDRYCNTVSLSYSQISGEEHWLEVSRMNRDAWSKEVEVVHKGYQEYLNVQSSDPGAIMETVNNEPLTILDRNAIRVSPLNVIMKMKFPDSGAVPAVANIHQLHMQVDTTGNCIGLGLNHYVSKNIIDARLNASMLDSAAASNLESHVMKMANIRYLKSTGSLIPETSNEDNNEKEYSLMIVWWSGSQHLLMYALNRPVPKDPWVKPDGVRSFSCAITVCELSPRNTLICVGLQNGMLLVIDVNSGLTKLIKKISNYSLRTINFVHYRDSEHVQYINVIDDKYHMFCVTYHTSLAFDNGQVTVVDSDPDSDAVLTISLSHDLVLSVSRQGPLIMRDMFSGTALLRIELGADVTVTSPWQPILALVDDNYLCVHASVNIGINEAEYQPATLVYKLDLDQFKHVEDAGKLHGESDSKSYVIDKVDAYLSRRHETHGQRQDRLQDYFVNLHQYLQISPVTVT